MKIEAEIKKHLHSFIKSLKTEYQGNKSSAKVVEKYLKGEKITPEDDLLLRRQLFDYLKYIGIVVPFIIIPGSMIILPLLVREAKKRNIDLLPSSFSEKKEEDKKEDEKP
ncbi:MAG: hypothetical protein WCY89_10385 [Flavobacteriaceae bacterium]